MKPLPPFQTWPMHHQDPRFGLAWYTAPAVFVNQIQVNHGTVDVACGIHDAIDHVLKAQSADIERHGGLLMIHDWRALKGYDSDARSLYLDRMRSRAPGYLRQVVAVLPPTPLLRMAVQTANIVMAFSSGGQLKMANDPAPVLAEHGVRHPTSRDWR